MEDLMALDACRPTSLSTLSLSLISSASPLPVAAWEQYLFKHPDGRFSKYILEGLASGFRIGYDCSSHPHPSSRNMKSAQENKEVVSRYIAKKLELNRLIHIPQSLRNQELYKTQIISNK